MSSGALHRAIGMLGGQSRAATLLKRKQSTLSGYLKASAAPAEICMRIEVATGGRITAESIRPDLAPEFSAFKATNRIPGSPRSSPGVAGRRQGFLPHASQEPPAGRDGPVPTRRAVSSCASSLTSSPTGVSSEKAGR